MVNGFKPHVFQHISPPLSPHSPPRLRGIKQKKNPENLQNKSYLVRAQKEKKQSLPNKPHLVSKVLKLYNTPKHSKPPTNKKNKQITTTTTTTFPKPSNNSTKPMAYGLSKPNAKAPKPTRCSPKPKRLKQKKQSGGVRRHPLPARQETHPPWVPSELH